MTLNDLGHSKTLSRLVTAPTTSLPFQPSAKRDRLSVVVTDRSVAASGPTAWNTNPSNIRGISNKETFCRHLKTYLSPNQLTSAHRRRVLGVLGCIFTARCTVCIARYCYRKSSVRPSVRLSVRPSIRDVQVP